MGGNPTIIAGPCSAEHETAPRQLTMRQLDTIFDALGASKTVK